MTQDPSVKSLLDIAQQTITAAGYASLITVDESGNPSSRAVAGANKKPPALREGPLALQR